jgi:hypothetical protein
MNNNIIIKTSPQSKTSKIKFVILDETQDCNKENIDPQTGLHMNLIRRSQSTKLSTTYKRESLRDITFLYGTAHAHSPASSSPIRKPKKTTQITSLARMKPQQIDVATVVVDSRRTTTSSNTIKSFNNFF